MSAKLDVEYIEIKNFLSYGNYVTKFDVSNKGPMLILGEIDENGTDTSNGAGKSSLVTAFIWCLFGRTISNRAPGDRVINWYSGKDCYVKVVTSDGWEIVRTRNIDGHSELIVTKDNDDKTKSTSKNAQKFLQDTFGLDFDIFTTSVFCGQFGKSFLEMTSVKRKESVERLLGVDKLNSYADLAKEKYKEVEKDQTTVRTKIELVQADCKRQQARARGIIDDQEEYEVNRLERIGDLNSQVREAEAAISQIESLDIDGIKKQWGVVKEIASKIGGYQQDYSKNLDKIKSAQGTIREAKASSQSYSGWPYDLGGVDLDELKTKHDLADRAGTKLSSYNQLLVYAKSDQRRLDHEVIGLTEKIEHWESKSDTICPTCEQDIDGDHVAQAVDVLITGLSEKEKELSNKTSEVSHLREIVTKLSSVNRPDMTVEEAKRLLALNEKAARDIEAATSQIEKAEQEIDRLSKANVELKEVIGSTTSKLEDAKPTIDQNRLQDYLVEIRTLKNKLSGISAQTDSIKEAKNPFSKIARSLEETIDELENEVVDLENKIEQLDILFAHYKYIYRSYSDRRKIKKWLLSELIPFLNNRVHYYLKALGIDIDISFNSTLDAKTDRWDYEFCSGGERKRMDLAIMFGLYDLYMSIYGKQCNIMVLDEVDSRLDRQSVEAFADVINDFNSDNSSYPRPSTILIISHKHELKDLIPSQVIVKKRNSFSVIDQT